MKTLFIRFISLCALGSVSLLSLQADTFTTTAGKAYDGEIYKILDGTVFLRVGEDKVEADFADFDAGSQDAIATWKAANPTLVDVYTKWDVQPRIVSSAMPSLPEQFKDTEFSGLVSVDLILDESGQVIQASIKKSTHVELELTSLEAAKTWKFEPAQVGGKFVRSKLRVPFKFVSTPPAPEEAPAT